MPAIAMIQYESMAAAMVPSLLRADPAQVGALRLDTASPDPDYRAGTQGLFLRRRFRRRLRRHGEGPPLRRSTSHSSRGVFSTLVRRMYPAWTKSGPERGEWQGASALGFSEGGSRRKARPTAAPIEGLRLEVQAPLSPSLSKPLDFWRKFAAPKVQRQRLQWVESGGSGTPRHGRLTSDFDHQDSSSGYFTSSRSIIFQIASICGT